MKFEKQLILRILFFLVFLPVGLLLVTELTTDKYFSQSENSPLIWQEHTFQDFIDGHFGDGGANTYVSAKGRIQLREAWCQTSQGWLLQVIVLLSNIDFETMGVFHLGPIERLIA